MSFWEVVLSALEELVLSTRQRSSRRIELKTSKAFSELGQERRRWGATAAPSRRTSDFCVFGGASQARSKPMCEIVRRLLEFGEFEVNIFGDDVSEGHCLLAALLEERFNGSNVARPQQLHDPIPV